MSKNQYRTSYQDMIHFREVNVKSDYPSGYGGHIPSIRHDILYKNTAFDRQVALRRNDPSRDAHPSFKDQISGIPTFCAKPQGAKKNPSYGVVPHDGTTTNLISPWAVVRPVKPTPSFRNVPATLLRTRSLPGIQGTQRVNEAARYAGAAVASPTAVASPMAASPTAEQMQSMKGEESPLAPQGSDRLKRQVNIANAQSSQQRMPSEQEMLMDEMGVQGYSSPDETAFYA
jgi:hypothetical protein